MSKEVITTAILMIASIVAVVAFVNAVLPAVYGLSESYTSLSRNMENQLKTDINVIFIYPEDNNVSVWIKNVGSSSIPFSQLQYSNVFVFSSSGYWDANFESGTLPSWDYTLENGDGNDYWNRGETLKLTIDFQDLEPGTYKLNFFLYNGVSASDTFSTST